MTPPCIYCKHHFCECGFYRNDYCKLSEDIDEVTGEKLYQHCKVVRSSRYGACKFEPNWKYKLKQRFKK